MRGAGEGGAQHPGKVAAASMLQRLAKPG
jgi:hypothetical protein